MTLLVTGAAGLISAALAHALPERGGRVVGLDDLSSCYDVPGLLHSAILRRFDRWTKPLSR
jgi:nucleoside-diphosphate-sugar epimerase